MLKVIPDSVLALLRHRWASPDDYSAFESMFTTKHGESVGHVRERQRDPSYYFIRKGAEVRTDWDCMSHAEALALIREGVFGALALDHGFNVAINEHASHALQDFCRAVYGAWAIYQDRLAMIECTCPHPPHE